ncbi:MAG: GNAT family N-acetyltransferase [Prevotellaceae bacterium]|nr:GNAT family N-acetyltransferase [Candidatus Colivivens equi]
MKVLSEIASINREQWDIFVANHPKGNVFQTFEYASVLVLTENAAPIVIAAMDGEELIGVMLGSIIVNGSSVLKWVTARSIIIGGPLAKNDNPQIVSALLKAYRELLPSYVIYTEIRPIYSMDNLELDKNGLKRVGHYNLVMDITHSLEKLFDSMHKERKRNVKQAEKAGLIFREITDKSSITDVVRLIRQTYERKHVPLSYISIFDVVYEQMSAFTHFFGAWTKDGQMIAGQVRLCYGHLMYAWFAGSDDAYFKLRPNDFLMWNVIRWGHEHGYTIFDFGGGGEPGKPYGVRDYKLKYGCECYDYGRYIYRHRPILYALASFAYKTLQKIQNKGKE